MTHHSREVPQARPLGPYLTMVLVFALVGACSDPVYCNNVATPALRVHVVDTSGEAVCDVTVRAQGPEPGEEFELNEFDCTFAGGFSEGEYTISILRGAQPLAAQMVTVQSDACGPVTRMVTIAIADS